MTIKISTTYTKTPGGRYKSEGAFSGEDFRESILLPEYERAKQDNSILEIDFDGGYGYATSFLEEAFGGLVRMLHGENISMYLKLISNEEPSILNKVFQYIDDSVKENKI